MKTKKQESAKWSREMAVVEKKKREKEMEMNKLKPLFIKAKEQTLHVVKRLEASKYDIVHIESLEIVRGLYYSNPGNLLKGECRKVPVYVHVLNCGYMYMYAGAYLHSIRVQQGTCMFPPPHRVCNKLTCTCVRVTYTHISAFD